MAFGTEVFPDICKLTRIIPVFKDGNSFNCTNYRNIYFLSILSRTFKKYMSVRLCSYLEKFELVYKYQYGFRRKHSTSHVLIKLIKYIKMHMDRRYNVCGLFIDLRKAFDIKAHKVFIEKRNYYGV